jgi:hypothetical protein
MEMEVVVFLAVVNMGEVDQAMEKRGILLRRLCTRLHGGVIGEELKH